MTDNPTYRTAVVFSACSREQARAALEIAAGEGGAGRVALVEPTPGDGPASWADETLAADAASLRLDETGFGRPDLFVLAVSNHPRYFSIKHVVAGLLLRGRVSPRARRIILFGWSGPRSLGDALPEVLKRVLCIPAGPIYSLLARLICAVIGPVLGLTGKDNRVLVVCLDLIGDLVWASPAIASIAASDDTEVHLLVSKRNVSIARLIPGVMKVITYEAPWLGKVHRPGGGGLALSDRLSNLGTRLALMAGGYGTALAFRGEPRDCVLMCLTGAKRRVSYMGGSAGCLGSGSLFSLLTDALPEPERGGEGGPHMLERNLRLAAAAGYSRRTETASLKIDPADRESVMSLLSGAGIKGNGPLIGMQPGASRQEKRWSAQGFSEVASKLMSEFGADVVLTGSADERGICDGIAAASPGVINLCGRTSLGEFAALVKECGLFVTNETSAISMASVLGTPVVCMMTGVPEMYGPSGVPFAVLQHRPECYDPVGEHCMCPYGYRCLKEIRPDDLFDAAVGLLGKDIGGAGA